HISPTIVADNAHNYIFQILAGTGIIGLSFFLVLVFYIFWESLKLIIMERGKNDNWWLIKAGIAASFFAYGLQLLTSVSIVGSTFFWWMIFGFILAQSNKLREKDINFKADSLWKRYLALVLIGIITIYGAISFFNIYRADVTFVNGSKSIRNGDLQATVKIFERAIIMNPYNDRYPAELGRILFSIARQTKSKVIYEQAEKAFIQAKLTSPLETDNYIFLADLYRFGGEAYDREYYQKGIEEANKAQQIAPYLYTAPYVRGFIYFQLGDFDSAIKNIEESLFYNPNFIAGFSVLGDIYLQKGDIAKAIESYEKVIEREPENARVNERLEYLKSVKNN
ncbi:MAG: tetratricopeptide repeat protein, partial [Actinomycetia bacterium]|nr:tetratricopeptide repeat protein [Actinomycetes bacterium]